jgi:GNAT superfamily N-acetyltransferase
MSKKQKVKNFKILKFGKVESRADYLSDVGMISPPYVMTDQFQIIPFEYVDESMQSQIINLLNDEFGKSSDIEYSNTFIRDNWTGANIFYVMTSPDRLKLYGTVAIDRKNFYPCISQLYIVEDQRGRDLAKHLINYSNRYIKTLNFSQSKLWCEDKLLNFYEKLGWKFESKKDNYNIMTYDL